MMFVNDNSCSFNIIYKFNNNIALKDTSVKDVRKTLSMNLVEHIKQIGKTFDIVSPIPNTGKFYTKEIARRLEVKEVPLIEKDKQLRTLCYDTEERVQYYEGNLKLRQSQVEEYRDANILFVDEALISGITLQAIAKKCLMNGITNFSFAFISPINFLYCPFGYIAQKEHMFALNKVAKEGFHKVYDEYKTKLKANDLIFMPYKLFKKAVGNEYVCSLCFHEICIDNEILNNE